MRVRHYKKKIIGISEIENTGLDIRRNHLTIVTTNGCFDILHSGHIEYLQCASNYGDILIVGINCDNSVRRLKGEGRPVNNEVSRASVIASLGFVDYCVIFSEDTPIEFLSRIRSHIHVKGGDYLARDLIEKKAVEENGGIIKILPLIKGFSTSEIIKKVTSL